MAIRPLQSCRTGAPVAFACGRRREKGRRPLELGRRKLELPVLVRLFANHTGSGAPLPRIQGGGRSHA